MVESGPADGRRDAEPGRRVLCVSEYFPPHWTGIAKSFFYMTQNMLAQGHQVTVLTTQYDAELPEQETIEGIKVIRSPHQLRISRTHYSFTILLRFIRLLLGRDPAGRSSYDTVVVNSPNSNVLPFALLTKLLGKRLVFFHQGDFILPSQTGNQLEHRLFERIFDVLTIPSFWLADVLMTYTRDYAERSRVMAPVLDSVEFHAFVPWFELPDAPPSPALREKLDRLAEAHQLIGIAGRFVEEKGFDILVEAIPHVVDEIPDALFVFAGKRSMEYEPFYEKHRDKVERNREHMTFLGLLHEGDLTYFYESLDVFVISSRSECFAMTQIEAVQKHVPVVVTDIPGARMLVTETGYGEVVPAQDPEGLARGIVQVLRHREAYEAKHDNIADFFERYDTFRIG